MLKKTLLNRVLTKLTILWIISAMLLATNVTAESREEAAVTSSKDWVALLDNQKYEQSWNQASSYFQSLVAKDQWVHTVSGMRSSFGKVLSRTLQTAQFTNSLPSAPDGEYVVIEFQTSFENKSAAIERITPMKDKDGTWRVSGYYVR